MPGRWLVDGVNHFEEEHGGNKKYGGTGLYKRAAELLGVEEQTLRVFKSLSETLPLLIRINNLTFNHHREAASLKTIEEDNAGTLAGRW